MAVRQSRGMEMVGMGFHFQSEALDAITRRFNWYQGVIRPRDVDIEYTFEEGEAISYLCDEWDFSHERWETYDPTTGGITLYSNDGSGEVIGHADKMEPYIQAELDKIFAEKCPMSEGYQRRPEEQNEWPWAFMLCVVMVFICGMAGQYAIDKPLLDGNRILQENKRLSAENAELTKQISYWTCRVQYEPSPMPEQVGEGPTLLPGEER